MPTLSTADLESSLGGLDLNVPLPQFDAANVLDNPLDICRSYLAEILCSLIECDPTVAYNSIQPSNNLENGDLVIILPRLCPGAKVNELGFDLQKKFPPCPLFGLPFLDGVHLRIMLMPETLPRLLLPFISDRKEAYGCDLNIGLNDSLLPESGRKRLVIEFSSPTITKDFEGKHLRSTIIGACISKMHQIMGWDVTKINYLGDWGKPIGLLGVGFEKFGSEEALQVDPIGHLLQVNHKITEEFAPEEAEHKRIRDEKGDTAELENQGLYAERNAFFKKMEDKNEEAFAFSKRVRDLNINYYTQLYARLGISFDEYSGESQVSEDTMNEIEKLLKDKGICEEKDGALLIDLRKHGMKSGAGIIRDRSSGSSTYLLRDLAAVLERSRKFEFEKMIFVVAADHNVHFSRVCKILELLDMPGLANKVQHVNFSEVSKMKEKLGAEYQPNEIIDQCQLAMLESLKAEEEKAQLLGDLGEAAKRMGINALLAQELSARRGNEHPFDISGMTSFKPGTGPDLQYWYAKLCSILKQQPGNAKLSTEDYDSLAEEDHANLLRVLAQYPDVTHAAYRSLEPATIMAYLVSVTEQLAFCFEEAKNNVTPAEAALYEATRQVLENGMSLLGLTPAVQVGQDL
ncbi:Nucleotidylyl transferase [Lindgomyces ingoldianus]|uniref:Nucleotidylyl transferase n=1 Tax=Lindgomyces ingoldianus TaxID=673940 RepID=A0ACB6R798_9PLEO|nr:Nucleotidylyl transferase [Lindgomyces ingoldianus]KAF2474683.1 Nucleotidylyl transferase [Lindgomyces ingoldianus]